MITSFSVWTEAARLGTKAAWLLSVVVSPTGCTSAPLQEDRGLASRTAFLEATEPELMELLGLRDLDTSSAFDRELRANLDRIDASFLRYQFPTQLHWSERDGSHASHVTGIGINREQLERIVERFGSSWRPLVYTTILAHEKAHMVQFREYGTSPYRAHPVRVAEIQADIFAGAYVIVGLLMPEMESVGRKAAEESRPIEDVIAEFLEYAGKLSDFVPALMESMGTLGVSWDVHPTPTQRNTAFFEGLQFQNLFLRWSHPYYRQDSSAYPESVRSLIPGGITEAEFREQSGLAEGEDFLHWSLRRAYAIAELPFVDTADLPDSRSAHSSAQIPDPTAVVETELLRLEWNEKQPGGPLEFAFELRNTSRRPLTCVFIMESGFIPRDKAEPRTYKVYRSQRFELALGPREVTEVKGELEWWATPQYMPTWESRVASALFTGPEPTTPAGFTDLAAAIAEGDLDAVRAAIAKGIDPSGKGDWVDEFEDVHEDVSPLYIAMTCGNEELALELVQQHSVDVRSAFGEDRVSTLHLAADADMPGLARALVAAGVRTGTSDENGTTPLHAAAKSRSIQTLGVLIELGAEIDARDEADTTPFLDAAGAGSVEAMRILLDHGADVRALDAGGDNAVFYAARSGSVDAVRNLLELGLKRDSLNEDGETPLDVVRNSIKRYQAQLDKRPSRYAEGRIEKLREVQTLLESRR